MKNFNNIKLFVQLENNNPEDGIKQVRYSCAGVINEKGQLSGLVYGYEGGGEYSEQLIINGNYIPNISDEDECLEFEEQIDYLDSLTETGFYEKCVNSMEEAMTYNQETCSYEVLPTDYSNGQLVHSEFPDNVTPPDYANTFWDNNQTGLYTIKELDKLVAA